MTPNLQAVPDLPALAEKQKRFADEVNHYGAYAMGQDSVDELAEHEAYGIYNVTGDGSWITGNEAYELQRWLLNPTLAEAVGMETFTKSEHAVIHLLIFCKRRFTGTWSPLGHWTLAEGISRETGVAYNHVTAAIKELRKYGLVVQDENESGTPRLRITRRLVLRARAVRSRWELLRVAGDNLEPALKVLGWKDLIGVINYLLAEQGEGTSNTIEELWADKRNRKRVWKLLLVHIEQDKPGYLQRMTQPYEPPKGSRRDPKYVKDEHGRTIRIRK